MSHKVNEDARRARQLAGPFVAVGLAASCTLAAYVWLERLPAASSWVGHNAVAASLTAVVVLSVLFLSAWAYASTRGVPRQWDTTRVLFVAFFLLSVGAAGAAAAEMVTDTTGMHSDAVHVAAVALPAATAAVALYFAAKGKGDALSNKVAARPIGQATGQTDSRADADTSSSDVRAGEEALDYMPSLDPKTARLPVTFIGGNNTRTDRRTDQRPEMTALGGPQ